MNDDRDIKDLLGETAAGITPRRGYEEIKERTVQENKDRRWVLPSVAAAAAMVLVVGGVGLLLREDDKAPDVAGPPTVDPSGAITASPDPEESARPATAFFVGQTVNGPRLFPDTVEVTTCGSKECFLLAAVSTVVDERPGDPDFSNPWSQVPEHTGLVVTTEGNEILIDFEAPEDSASPVDLTSRPAGMDALTAELAVQQLVYTARTALGDELPVRFRINHANTPTLLGVATAEPLTAADADEIQAPVQIGTVTAEGAETLGFADGTKVPAGRITIGGRAAAFEANVQWEIEDATGSTIKEGYATAQECCTLSPYSFDVDLAPGTYLVVVHDEDMSGENRPVNEDTKRIVVE